MGTLIDDDVSDGEGEALLLEFITTEGDGDGDNDVLSYVPPPIRSSVVGDDEFVGPCVGKYVGITVGSKFCCCPGDGDTVGL